MSRFQAMIAAERAIQAASAIDPDLPEPSASRTAAALTDRSPSVRVIAVEPVASLTEDPVAVDSVATTAKGEAVAGEPAEDDPLFSLRTGEPPGDPAVEARSDPPLVDEGTPPAASTLELGRIGAAADRPVPVEPPAPSLAEAAVAPPAGDVGDLHRLPQIGDGMRAKLAALGVTTLAELAAVDPQRLRSGLGPLSRLANVDGWIALAKRELTGEP